MGRVSCGIPKRNTRTAVLPMCVACSGSFFFAGSRQLEKVKSGRKIPFPTLNVSGSIVSCHKQGCKLGGLKNIPRLNSTIHAYHACCCLDNVFYETHFAIQLEPECISNYQSEDSVPNVSGVHILIFRHWILMTSAKKKKKKKSVWWFCSADFAFF